MHPESHTASNAGGRACCPGCERYIGAAAACPYCGADAVQAPLKLALRAGMLALALLATGFLYLLARNRELPRLDIGALTPLMNRAAVRVAGRVPRTPYVARRDGRVEYVSFLIDDGTGAIRVCAEDDVARALAGADALPARGSRADAQGRLALSGEGRLKLRLLSAAHLQWTPGRGGGGRPGAEDEGGDGTPRTEDARQ